MNLNKKKYSRIVQLGLNSKPINVINLYTTLISIALCFVALLFILNGTKNVMELEVKATQIMKKKIVHDTVRVVEDRVVNDCDTVYVVDGVHMRRAN